MGAPKREDLEDFVEFNGDYVSLAYRIEPLIKDLLDNNRHPWEPIIQNGIKGIRHHTPATEEKSVVGFWSHFNPS